MIVFGGCTEDQEYCDDIHIFNSKTFTWHQPSITGSLSARYLHSATIYEDKLYVYGGFAKTSDCKATSYHIHLSQRFTQLTL